MIDRPIIKAQDVGRLVRSLLQQFPRLERMKGAAGEYSKMFFEGGRQNIVKLRLGVRTGQHSMISEKEKQANTLKSESRRKSHMQVTA